MKIIAKEKWPDFVAKLIEDYEVYAPVEAGEAITFQKIREPKEGQWHYANTTTSAKGVFLPQTETLFCYEMNNGHVKLEPIEDVAKDRVLLAVRPCDARAVSILDRVFDTEEKPDVYYVNRRRRTTIVALGCNVPRSTCFCTAVGGDPFGKEGADVLLTDLGDRYLAEPLTPRGEALLSTAHFREATQKERSDAKRIATHARKQMAPLPDTTSLPSALGGMIEAPIWQALQERCLGCAVCAYVCPTCYCFDIVDEVCDATSGKRVRNWDCCQFAVYTLEASGHNPRPTGRERMRQRVMHKFNYMAMGGAPLGCVGCGRCVISCPVNIDIREILGAITAAKAT
ncbi:MAG: 4Fe-4S dicluster domain-containing protein [Chloroflexi bacterium]|nr:4Fe-4S dicluster domain-containing protein [Chloroflexota bacterium]